MAGTKLLPCPFCGGEAEILTAESMNGGYLFGIMCNDCCSRGDVYDTEAEAIEAWNTRAPMSGEDLKILLDELDVSERTCHIVTDGSGWWECDACGCSFDWDSFDRDDPPNCNYCPNCGAKVVSE